MADGIRTQRVAERVRTELSTLFARSIRDPGVAGITVTHVSMSPDLQLARVYYTLVPEADRRDTARALRRARPWLRRALGRAVQLRHVPEIRFLYDDSAERQDRMARLFDDIAASRTETAPAPADEDSPAAPDTEDDGDR